MDWLNQLDAFANSSIGKTLVQQLGPKAPQPVSAPTVAAPAAAYPSDVGGMSQGTMLAIGAAVVGLIVVVFALRK